ncbi:putative DYW domain-containing protein [Helianthus anomalus]
MTKITLCRMRLIKCEVRLVKKIKEIGYVPDTSHVLLYVDEQEREVKLQYHSAKLALAFALSRTPPGSTIRIKKNIRVCGDCHSAFTYASLVVEREIILRDTNRFHHFYRGSCSCGDYWCGYPAVNASYYDLSFHPSMVYFVGCCARGNAAWMHSKV